MGRWSVNLQDKPEGKQLVKSPRQDCTGRETFGKVIKLQLCQNVVFPCPLSLAIVFGYLITGAALGKGGHGIGLI